MKISLAGISKSFNGARILDKLDLEIAGQSFTTLLGPSGCGKTTLLRLIAGLETPDAGEIYFDGNCVFSCALRINVSPEKRGLAFVFQDFALWPHMTVFENVAFGLRALNRKENLARAVHEALEAVRLGDFASRYPHQLSGGQQQRVAFARAIAVNPPCILFDEPLSALDAILRDEMRAELKELVQSRGITSVFVTHDQMEAMSLSDEIVVMEKGKILQQGAPEDIYRRPADVFVAKFVGRSDWLDERKMIRPENVGLTPRKGATELPMRVLNSQYHGNAYELTVTDGKLRWVVMSPESYAPDAAISVFVNRENIVHF